MTECQWDCTIRVAKTKALISFAVIAKLICVFVFAYTKSRFSHDADHIIEEARYKGAAQSVWMLQLVCVLLFAYGINSFYNNGARVMADKWNVFLICPKFINIDIAQVLQETKIRVLYTKRMYSANGISPLF